MCMHMYACVTPHNRSCGFQAFADALQRPRIHSTGQYEPLVGGVQYATIEPCAYLQAAVTCNLSIQMPSQLVPSASCLVEECMHCSWNGYDTLRRIYPLVAVAYISLFKFAGHDDICHIGRYEYMQEYCCCSKCVVSCRYVHHITKRLATQLHPLSSQCSNLHWCLSSHPCWLGLPAHTWYVHVCTHM